MKRPATLFSLLLIAALALPAAAPPSLLAQKKKGASAGEQSARPAVQSGTTIRDVLVKLQGQQTNLGTLVRVTGEVVEFENEGDTLIYPLSAVQSVKFLKAEEGEARKVEIKFLARD
jgi:hypothetical protein